MALKLRNYTCNSKHFNNSPRSRKHFKYALSLNKGVRQTDRLLIVEALDNYQFLGIFFLTGVLNEKLVHVYYFKDSTGIIKFRKSFRRNRFTEAGKRREIKFRATTFV